MNTIETLKHDLLAARKARDEITTQTLQAALARITNAEAVPIENTEAAVGVGSTETARRELTEEHVKAILHDEITEAREALASMKSQPDHPYAVKLKQTIDILTRYQSS